MSDSPETGTEIALPVKRERSHLQTLTAKHVAIAQAIARGFSNAEIAELCGTTPGYVKKLKTQEPLMVAEIEKWRKEGEVAFDGVLQAAKMRWVDVADKALSTFEFRALAEAREGLSESRKELVALLGQAELWDDHADVPMLFGTRREIVKDLVELDRIRADIDLKLLKIGLDSAPMRATWGLQRGGEDGQPTAQVLQVFFGPGPPPEEPDNSNTIDGELADGSEQ